MTNITKFIEEMNKTNSTNDKIATLTKYKEDVLVQRVLKMTYDKVSFVFGVTMKNVKAGSSENTRDLPWALDQLERLAKREVTGNAAIGLVENILESMSEDDREVIIKIIGRDLKINMGRTNINKVMKGLIIKPPYKRCDIGTEKNVKKNIDFSKRVYSELKMDGTYRSASVDGDDITIMSRSGNEDVFPIIEDEIRTINIDGYVLLGEMTLRNEQDRSKGNGIINSITEREEKQDDIIFTVWEIVPVEEYMLDKKEIKVLKKENKLIKYGESFSKLEKLLTEANLSNVKLIEYKLINNMREAYEHFQEVTERGDEGTVIKSEDMVWEDGTSKMQLKVKLVISAEVRCTGFIEGTPGTKREKTFGSIAFENDEGTIKGSTSGFTDAQLEDFNSRRDELIGRVFEVEFNDITKARNSETYAFSHPRFIEFRNDKNSTDTLERCFEMKEMAMNIE